MSWAESVNAAVGETAPSALTPRLPPRLISGPSRVYHLLTLCGHRTGVLVALMKSQSKSLSAPSRDMELQLLYGLQSPAQMPLPL